LGGGNPCGVAAPPLHLLLRKRRIEDIFRLHVGQQLEEVGRGSVLGRIRIPYLDDIVCLFGANGNAVYRIGGVGGEKAENGRNAIRDECLAGILFDDSETVGPTIHIVTVFPEGRNGVSHQEEHAVRECIGLEFFNDAEEFSPSVHGSCSLKGPDAPLGFIG